MFDAIRRLVWEEQGQTLVEYALILALVALTVIGMVAFMGGRLKNSYNNINNNMSG